MRLLMIADPHNREVDFQVRLDAQRSLVERRDWDCCCMLGDLFHSNKLGGPSLTAQEAARAVSAAYTTDRPVIMLEGNHDQLRRGGSALDFIGAPNISKVMGGAQRLLLDNTELFLLPWIKNYSEEDKAATFKLLNRPSKASSRLVLGHCNLAGTEVAPGWSLEETDYFCFRVSWFTSSQFRPTHGFFGHIHTPHNLGAGFRYLGALSELRFGERSLGGAVIFDTDRDSYEVLAARTPRYWSITEKEYSSVDEFSKNYDWFRFETSTPEHYAGQRVKPIIRNSSYRVGEHEETKEGIDLFGEFVRGLSLSDRLAEEVSRLCPYERGHRGSFTRVNSLSLQAISGISTSVSFTNGLNVIVGRNGSGKTILLESIYASLYDKFVRRGSLKNYMDKGSAISTSFETNKGSVLVEKRTHKKSLHSSIVTEDGRTDYELAGQFRAEIDHLVGDQQTFASLCFLDCYGSGDVVDNAGNAERMQEFARLLNLSYLEEEHKEFKKRKQTAQETAARVEGLRQEIEERRAALSGLSAEADEDLSLLESKINNIRNNEKAYQKYKADKAAYDFYIEDMRLLGENQIQVTAALDKHNKAKEIRKKLKDSCDLAGVGCAASPLPCKFLVNLEDRQKLEQQLKELELSPTEDRLVVLWKYRKTQEPPGEPEPVADYVEEPLDLLEQQYKLKLEVKQANQRIRNTADLLRREIAAREKQLAEVEENQDTLSVDELDFLAWFTGKQGLSLHYTKQAVNRLQFWLDWIAEGLDFRFMPIVFVEDSDGKQNLCFHMKKPNKPSYDVRLGSDGERTFYKVIFKIALNLFFSDLHGSYKVLMADEPEKGLDEYSLELLLQVFDKIKGKFNQVILATHSSVFVGMADYVKTMA